MGGISSWSSDKEVATEYSTKRQDGIPVMYICSTANKGISVEDVALFEDEHEVLVSDAAEYEIQSMNNETVQAWDDYSGNSIDKPVVMINLKEV